MNDLNKQILILKTKIQNDITKSNLPISVVALVLKDLMTEVRNAENEYFRFLAQKEKEDENKEEEVEDTEEVE